jgi:Protein of unknown function (DUF3048) N-terminal domain/Protein of unknown function (DUF3048) C-terminal domain
VAAAGAVVVVVALAACSGGSTPATTTSANQSASLTATPTPTPTPTPTIERSFLSGRIGGVNGPVLVVKMDNTPESNPHAGIKFADVVYIEQVEGGLSRYAVVFSSQIPKAVGPVRSARIADIELLRQYGKVAFAYSGVQTLMLPVLRSAYLYNVSDDYSGQGYYRDNSRWFAPYNLFADPLVLFKRAPGAVHATNVGFTFAETVPAGGRPVHAVSASFPATRVSLTWDETSRWLAAMNGVRAMALEGGQLGGTTVIIQYVTVTRSIYRDVNNNYTPMSTTVGTGNALILRNGQEWNATWSRPSLTRGTTWLVGGRPFPLAAGQIWILLINKTTPATLS